MPAQGGGEGSGGEGVDGRWWRTGGGGGGRWLRRGARARLLSHAVCLCCLSARRARPPSRIAHRGDRGERAPSTKPRDVIFARGDVPAIEKINHKSIFLVEDGFFSGRAVESVGPPDRALWPCGVLVGPPDRALWPCGEFGRAARPSALAFGAMVSRLDRALSPRESASGGAPLGAWLLRRARCADACPCTPSHARDRTRSDRSPVSLSRRQHSPTSLVRTVYACSAR